MAILITAFFLQVASAAPVELPLAPGFYTTENLIAVLIGVISLVSALVLWFVSRAIISNDNLLSELSKKVTVLEQHKMVHEFGYKIVDQRLEKLETWKEEVQRAAQNNH